MKYCIVRMICAVVLSSVAITASAQFSYLLTGNPVNTTGWVMGSPTTTVSGNAIILTGSTTGQAGYIYYNQPVSLTSCAEFVVHFEYRIDNSSNPPADGIAFWYITAPPTGFIVGGGMGLPTNPTGFGLFLDTYDNNAPTDAPVVSARYLNNSNYVENSPVGLIGSQMPSQNYVFDGNWHSCDLTYNNGNISVSMDGAPPAITGYYLLNMTGYFGFSAATGASWSTHAIRNVAITGATVPPPIINTPVVYCQDDVAIPLTATGTNLKWFDQPTGGTVLPAAPTPNTSVPGTTYWYVSQTIPNCGESNRDTIEVIVKPRPQAPTVVTPVYYCTGEAATALTATAAGTLLWYTLSSGGVGDPNAPLPSTASAGTTTYYVSQVVDGCESQRAALNVEVEPEVVAEFSYVIHYGCSEDTVIFTNASTPGVYEWTFGDNSSGSAQQHPVHIYGQQGSFNVTLKTIAGRCEDEVTHTVLLDHPLKASFDVDADTLCLGQAVTFTNTSTAPPHNNIDPIYTWDFGDGLSSTDASPVHTYAEAGVYTVRMVVTNFIPCSDTAVKQIYVDAFPDITFTATDSIRCEGESIGFAASYQSQGFRDILWDFGDGTTKAGWRDITHAYDTPGVYTVRVTASYRVCPDVDTSMDIVVHAFPAVDLGRDTFLCPNGPGIQLEARVPGDQTSLRWLWSSGDTVSSITVRHHGSYFTTVSRNGCAASDTVAVFKDCYIDIPNVFTPNNDGMNDYFFPRQLLSHSVSKFFMQVYNRWGQLIFETRSIDGRGWDGRFNDREQPQGVYVYLIDVSFGSGNTEHYTGNVTMLR